MRLAHFASKTDEYVVLVDGDNDVFDYQEEGYDLESESEIQFITRFPGDVPEYLPTGYPLRLDRS